MLRALALWLALSAATALAQPTVTADDFAEIRSVIQRQLEAFRRDDAQGAFALASPGVQQAFGTAERFLHVVRSDYGPMARPANVAFLEPVILSGEAVQPVKLTERGGAVWLAYYAMQRQRDGRWRANGCHLVQPAKTVPT